jgi:hypothetical protein
MGDKNDCNNYRGISLLPTAYTILSNIVLAKLTPYSTEVIGDHEYGFRRNISTTDQIFYIRHILEKKLKTSGKSMTHYERSSLQYSASIWYAKKLVRPIRIRLNETYSKVRAGKFCPIISY